MDWAIENTWPTDLSDDLLLKEYVNVLSSHKDDFDQDEFKKMSLTADKMNQPHFKICPKVKSLYQISKTLDFLNDHITEFPKKDKFYIHCAGGYRSVIAASILKARGFHNVVDVAGGYGAIKKTEIQRTAAVCPSTLK